MNTEVQSFEGLTINYITEYLFYIYDVKRTMNIKSTELIFYFQVSNGVCLALLYKIGASWKMCLDRNLHLSSAERTNLS